VLKKHKRFGIKIYKLCDSKGYAYDTSHCIGNDRQVLPLQLVMHLQPDLTAKLEKWDTNYTWTCFSSAVLFGDTINCCGTVRPNRKEMPKIF